MLILRNKIKDLIQSRGVSINKMATDLDIHYPTMHNLVNRETLNGTTLESVVRVADYLGVPVKKFIRKKL